METFKKVLENQRGVALMMVMTSIIILMAIYGEFTFDSKISRIKATNIMDKSQAKLLAESALQLGMTRLKLYKEAYNKVQGNATAKGAVSPQLLNQLWETPFMFPVPKLPGANRSFLDTVEKFEKESLLDGQMKLTIQNISNRMNLNLLRMDMTKFDPNHAADDANSRLDMSDTAIQTHVSVDQTLYFLLKKLVEEKKDRDESFADRVGSINYQTLVSNLKFYISDYQSLIQDPFAGESERTFQNIPLSPKYGPFSSSSEFYSIPGWTDELIEMVQNEFSVYPSNQIDLNKLTANMLRILIPQIQEADIKEFFEWRDDPEVPKFINTKEDFKKYIVDIAHLMSENDFNERMKRFEEKGFSFGSNPNLFRVLAEGTYNRAVYTLVAYVVLPNSTTSTNATGQPGTNNNNASGGNSGAAQPTQTTQLLEPRIIEIQIN